MLEVIRELLDTLLLTVHILRRAQHKHIPVFVEYYCWLDWMLVHCGVSHSIKFTGSHFFPLGSQRHCESELRVLSKDTQYNNHKQGSNPDYLLFSNTAQWDSPGQPITFARAFKSEITCRYSRHGSASVLVRILTEEPPTEGKF